MTALVVLVAGVGIWTVTGEVRAGGERRRMQSLVESMREARVALDSCRTSLGEEQTAFRAFDHGVDSLKQALEDFESAGGRVPAARYDAYLSTFERYNAAVPEWQERADSLRAHWRTCSELTRRHNEIVDTLRELAQHRRARDSK